MALVHNLDTGNTNASWHYPLMDFPNETPAPPSGSQTQFPDG